MYYGGRPEKSHPVAAFFRALTGAAAGCAVGFMGFLLATFFPHLLHTALPNMTPTWFLGLWAASLAVPVLAFSGVLRNGKGLGTKLYAGCGIAAILLLFAGDLTGVKHVFPWGTRFSIAPAVEQPETPAPLRR